jgi:ribonuclease P protein component
MSRFPKSEKLKSQKTIEQLFAEGKSVTKFPVKVFFLKASEGAVSQAGFAVPKRAFKNAVARNRIKRQLREAFRLNKQLLTTNNGSIFALLFLYIGKDEPQYASLETAIKALLQKIQDEGN